MKAFVYITLLFSLLCFQSPAQTSTLFTIPLGAVIDVDHITADWNPVIRNIEAPKPDGPGTLLKQIKDQLAAEYPKKSTGRKNNRGLIDSLAPPMMFRNFQGNPFASSTPNDNDIAVSNGGKIISVQNTNIFRYDIPSATPIGYTISLNAFFSPLVNYQSKYDPKVIYDPVEDRFILLCLAGTSSTATAILLAFSQSNDPAGTWNMYSIPGNPLNDTLWTDFPMITLTQQEVFITVNHLFDNQPWQTGFKRTVIWQIKKENAYAGLPLDALLHHQVEYGGKPVRNLCPVKGGSALYGPGMYFLSDRNLSPTNDTIFLVYLNDTIGAPGQQITVTPLISNIAYFAPPTAAQPSSTGGLQTNDARVLGAFIENGQIQYAQNSMDTTSGFAAIVHGVIDSLPTNPVITARLITDTLTEFGYPNLSYAGTGPGDNTTIISFDHSGATVFPGFSAMTWDGNVYSPVVVIKPGDGYINVISGDDRWGDYSGSQRKYNGSGGEVWISGMFGRTNHQHATWIAQLGLDITVGITNPTANKVEISNYPNPFINQFEVEFNLEKPERLRFEIYDAWGRMVSLLLEDKIKAGINHFSFSGASLPAGNYVLKIGSASQVIALKKIIKI